MKVKELIEMLKSFIEGFNNPDVVFLSNGKKLKDEIRIVLAEHILTVDQLPGPGYGHGVKVQKNRHSASMSKEIIMGVDVYGFLAIGRTRDDILKESKLVEEDIDDLVEDDEENFDLDRFCYNYLKCQHDLIGIKVTKSLNGMEGECFLVLEEKSLSSEIEIAKKKFKDLTGIEGNLMLVSNVSC